MTSNKVTKSFFRQNERKPRWIAHLNPPPPRNAFALISSLLLLTLLVGLIVILLGFMRLETRVSASQQEVAQARQNALAGLQVVVGEFQIKLGPDHGLLFSPSTGFSLPFFKKFRTTLTISKSTSERLAPSKPAQNCSG